MITAAVVTVCVVQLISICTIFKVSHALIRPLRKLNTKMKEVMMDEGADNDLTTQVNVKSTSQEISKLYTVFTDLIKDKKFSENDFLKNPDS